MVSLQSQPLTPTTVPYNMPMMRYVLKPAQTFFYNPTLSYECGLMRTLVQVRPYYFAIPTCFCWVPCYPFYVRFFVLIHESLFSRFYPNLACMDVCFWFYTTFVQFMLGISAMMYVFGFLRTFVQFMLVGSFLPWIIGP